MNSRRNSFIARLFAAFLALMGSQSVLRAESPAFDAVAMIAPPMPRPNPSGVNTGACCIGAVDCIIITQFDCEDEGHTWLGPDTLCVNCPALPQCPETGVLLAQQVYDPTVFSSATTSEISSGFSVFDHFSGVAGAVESLTWWGLDMQPVGNHFEECEETNNTFFIAFHSGDAGQPGNVVCSWLVNATRTPLNIRYFGAELNEYHAVLPASCVLTRGWVSIIGAGDPQCWFIWMSSPDGDEESYCDGCAVGPQSSDYAVCFHGEVGGIYGACCHDASSTCMDEKTEITQCLGDGMRFVPNQTCDSLNPPCGTVFGACCISTFECSIETLNDCAVLGGNWIGAESMCSQCPCAAYCPPHGRPEPEPPCSEGFVDTINGGCDIEPHVFSPIAIGDVVCGTSGFFSGSGDFDRDFDWYELNVSAQTDILWEVVAEFTATISIIDASAGCPGTVLDSATVPPCVQHAVYWFADQPGTYWLVIGSDGFDDVDFCPAKYTVSVPTPFGCPPGDVNQDQVRDGRDVQGFVDCIVLGSTTGGSCPCADVTGDGVPTMTDISPFVSGLLGD